MIDEMYKAFLECFERGNRVFVAGNGGSSAEASHLSEEFISLGYPVIALNDPAVITALINDFLPEEVFARYLTAIAKPHDLFVNISTSGKSKNILAAIYYAMNNHIDILDFPRRGKTISEIQNNQLVDIHKLYEKFKGGKK